MNEVRLGILADRHPVSCSVVEQASRRTGFAVDYLDLAAACLPDGPGRGLPVPPAVQDLRPWLAAADCFVAVTAEDPGPLVNAVGWFGEVWRARPVGLVSYGGAAPIRRLRLAFAQVGALVVAGTTLDHMLDLLRGELS